jgi:hypothetical protein
MDQKDIYKAFHPTAAEYILLISTWSIFWDRPYVRPKVSLNKFKKFKIISYILSDHKGIKLKKKRTILEIL